MDFVSYPSLVSIAVVLLLAISASSYPTDSTKCTPNDKRQKLFPKCMQGDDMILWCDYSNYTEIPNPETHSPGRSFKNSIGLYVTDSCIQGLTRDEMAMYPNLEDFRCGKNLIESISSKLFMKNRKLRILNFCTNSISHIGSKAFLGLHKLEILNLTNNKLATLSQSMFYDLSSLRELSLAGNEIQILNNDTFKHLRKLETLSLTGNEISRIDENAFSGLGDLLRLHLDGNKLASLPRTIFTHVPKLKVLTLSYNKFLAMPDLAENSLANLHTLNLGHNILESFEIRKDGNLSKLQNLSLENNSLLTISEDLFHHMPSLRFLNLSSNSIEEISQCAFSKSCHLEVLSLSDNKLKIPHAEWFSSVIRNGIVNGTNISGNSWNCNCETIPFNNFLSNVAEEWRKVLDVTCHWPKRHKGKSVSDAAFTFKDSPTCYGSSSKGHDSPCNVTGENKFVRQTEVYSYQPTIQTEETAEPKVLPSVKSSMHPAGKAGYEVESPKSDGSSSFILFGVVVICIVVLALIVVSIVIVYLRKRDSSGSKMKGNRNSCSSSAGLLSKTSSRSDSYVQNNEHSPKELLEEDVFLSKPSSITTASSDETSSKNNFQITREKQAKGNFGNRTSAGSDSGFTSNRSSSVQSDLTSQTMSNQSLLSQIKEAEVNVSCPSVGESDYHGNCRTIPKIIHGDPSLGVKSTISGDLATPSQLPIRQDPIGGNTKDHIC